MEHRSVVVEDDEFQLDPVLDDGQELEDAPHELVAGQVICV